MKEKIVDAVGFDLDNTLYPPNEEVDRKIQEFIYQKASQVLGREYDEVKRDFDSQYAVLKSGRRSLLALGIPTEEQAIEIVQEALENADVASILKKDKRLVKLLDHLTFPYRVFLITSSQEHLAQDKLHALGIDEKTFYPRLYRNSGRVLKREDGSAFKYVAEVLHLPFERMMFVGDRESVDILPATQLGMKTAIVHATSEKATFQLQSIYELEQILLQ